MAACSACSGDRITALHLIAWLTDNIPTAARYWAPFPALIVHFIWIQGKTDLVGGRVPQPDWTTMFLLSLLIVLWMSMKCTVLLAPMEKREKGALP